MRKYIVPPIPNTVWKKPTHFIAFGFGAGTLPKAPGTFGTLAAIPFYLAMQQLSHISYFVLLIVIILASIWLCEKVSREIHIHDHQGMCLDEIAGYLVTMFAAPHGIKWIMIGFILFRLFDIFKPPPIKYIDEKINGGIGMILDDVVAGIYSMIIIHILSWVM